MSVLIPELLYSEPDVWILTNVIATQIEVAVRKTSPIVGDGFTLEASEGGFTLRKQAARNGAAIVITAHSEGISGQIFGPSDEVRILDPDLCINNEATDCGTRLPKNALAAESIGTILMAVGNQIGIGFICPSGHGLTAQTTKATA